MKSEMKSSRRERATFEIDRAMTRIRRGQTKRTIGREMERELGDKFTLAAYHQAVIGHGSIPVKYLPELVRADLGMVHQ